MQELVELVQRKARERAQRFVGRTVEVLVEGPSRTDPELPAGSHAPQQGRQLRGPVGPRGRAGAGGDPESHQSDALRRAVCCRSETDLCASPSSSGDRRAGAAVHADAVTSSALGFIERRVGACEHRRVVERLAPRGPAHAEAHRERDAWAQWIGSRRIRADARRALRRCPAPLPAAAPGTPRHRVDMRGRTRAAACAAA